MKYFILLVFFFTPFNILNAQDSIDNQKTNPQKVVTENGDELCIVSNGNKVPCIFLEEAEQSVKILETEKSTCYKDGAIINCNQLDESGSIKLSHQINEKLIILRMYSERYLFGLLFILILVVVFSYSHIKRYAQK